jgi:hypothetical protein
MEAQTMLKTLLFLHLIGLIMIAGSTLVGFIVYSQFWKQFNEDKEKGITIIQTISKLTVLTATGGLVLILTGVGMMAVTRGVFDQFTWFKIKMAVLLLLILNVVLVGRRNFVKLRNTVKLPEAEGGGAMLYLQKNISRFQYAQISFLLLIILLSVFKFN